MVLEQSSIEPQVDLLISLIPDMYILPEVKAPDDFYPYLTPQICYHLRQ